MATATADGGNCHELSVKAEAAKTKWINGACALKYYDHESHGSLVIIIICVVVAVCVTAGCLYYFLSHKKAEGEVATVAAMDGFNDDLYSAFIDNETA